MTADCIYCGSRLIPVKGSRWKLCLLCEKAAFPKPPPPTPVRVGESDEHPDDSA